jgi:hypothetical protein
MMSDVISRLIGKKFRKFSFAMAIQIKVVNNPLTPKSSFLIDFGPRNVDLLKEILSELKTQKLIEDNLTIATLESEIFIINTKKVMERNCESFHIIDISDEVSKPQLISDKLFFFESVEKIKEKLSENRGSELIDLGSFGFNSPTIFGFLINYPVLYFCKTENNCLSNRELKVFQIHDDENHILISFSVPLEILNENQVICDDINKFLEGFQSYQIKSFITSQENVIL